MLKMTDSSLLEMALIGYEAEREKIQQKIAEIQKQLGGRTRLGVSPAPASTTPAKRRMSAAARKRIAAAQKKRWAEYRRKQKAA